MFTDSDDLRYIFKGVVCFDPSKRHFTACFRTVLSKAEEVMSVQDPKHLDMLMREAEQAAWTFFDDAEIEQYSNWNGLVDKLI